jgi:hypothetical protein
MSDAEPKDTAFTNNGLYPARNFCDVHINVPENIANAKRPNTCGFITINIIK